MDPAQISVIIPAFNEEENMERCLNALLAQDYSNFRIRIIDDHSSDNTVSIIQKFVHQYPDRIYLSQYGKVGPGKARNLASYEEKSAFLAFTDADCYPQKEWLSELIKGFIDERVGSTGGPHLAPPDSLAFQKRLERFLQWIAFATGFYKNAKGSEILDVEHNPLCNVAYRREVFTRLRGFREDLFPGEDVEMDLRVQKEGYRITHNPKAIVFHQRPKTIEEWKKVIFCYGRAQGKLVRESGFQRKTQVFGVGLFFLLAALVWGLLYNFGVFGALFSFLILIAVFFFRPKSEQPWSIAWNSLGWLNGFLKGFITGKSDPPGKQT